MPTTFRKWSLHIATVMNCIPSAKSYTHTYTPTSSLATGNCQTITLKATGAKTSYSCKKNPGLARL